MRNELLGEEVEGGAEGASNGRKTGHPPGTGGVSGPGGDAGGSGSTRFPLNDTNRLKNALTLDTLDSRVERGAGAARPSPLAEAPPGGAPLAEGGPLAFLEEAVDPPAEAPVPGRLDPWRASVIEFRLAVMEARPGTTNPARGVAPPCRCAAAEPGGRCPARGVAASGGRWFWERVRASWWRRWMVGVAEALIKSPAVGVLMTRARLRRAGKGKRAHVQRRGEGTGEKGG